MNPLEERLDMAGCGGYQTGNHHDTPDEGPPIEDWWALPDVTPFEAGREIGEALFFLTALDEEE